MPLSLSPILSSAWPSFPMVATELLGPQGKLKWSLIPGAEYTKGIYFKNKVNLKINSANCHRAWNMRRDTGNELPSETDVPLHCECEVPWETVGCSFQAVTRFMCGPNDLAENIIICRPVGWHRKSELKTEAMVSKTNKPKKENLTLRSYACLGREKEQIPKFKCTLHLLPGRNVHRLH